jgi:hypothetical protein
MKKESKYQAVLFVVGEERGESVSELVVCELHTKDNHAGAEAERCFLLTYRQNTSGGELMLLREGCTAGVG